MMHVFSAPFALFLLATASLPAGQATTTTTALEPFNDPTTTESTSGGASGGSDSTTSSDADGDGATRTIMGSFLVNNVDYAALNNDTSLKLDFENECKSTIASAAGTSP